MASRLRRERVPCDVLHVDTGWTDVTFRMDFEFSSERFPDPEHFLEELREQLSSHVRCHGAPPREPWELGDGFLARFRRLAELRYSLLPYVVEQAEAACERGHPLLRPIFFEFPGDPGCWLVEDQYMLGTDLLVAPLFEDVSERQLYLPPGRWHRFGEDEGTALDGPGWHTLAVEEVPAAAFVRDGAALRIAEPAQHTGELDWDGARSRRPAG